MTTFSPPSDIDNVALVVLDKAPAPPVRTVHAYQDGGNVTGKFGLVNSDFDGTTLTGLNNAYVFGAFKNDDGTSAIEGLSGQQCLDAGYLKQKFDVTPSDAAAGLELTYSYPQAPHPNGNEWQDVIFVSDEAS